jgi:hypothetical protein
MLDISLRRELQEIPNIFCPGPLSDMNTWSKENILVEMREEAFMWPKWTYPFRIQDLGSSFKGRRIDWRKESLCRRRRIKEE